MILVAGPLLDLVHHVREVRGGNCLVMRRYLLTKYPGSDAGNCFMSSRPFKYPGRSGFKRIRISSSDYLSDLTLVLVVADLQFNKSNMCRVKPLKEQ